MAHFYGRLQGNRGEATRLGTKSSGISVTAESWESVLRASQHWDATEGCNEGWFSVEHKYGGTALSLYFKADLIVKHRNDAAVAEAAEQVARAVDALNEAATMAQIGEELTA